MRIALRTLLAVTVLVASETLAVSETRQERVDALFAKWDRDDFPGCALGVIEDGRLSYERGYGMANLEHDVPLSSKSVFRTGSVSKQFAAFAMLLAEQQGKLDLDDDVRKYVPELPEIGEKITIRHLIHHTSGMRDYLVLMGLRGQRDEDFYTEDEVVDALARQERSNFAPGSEYLYSNSGYFLLSQIILRAAGMGLRDFSETNIFAPLKMEHTHFHDDFRRVVKHRAAGYQALDEGGFEISMTTLNMVGDGGVYTTIEDLVAWDRNFYTGEVGGEELRAKRVVPGTLDDGTDQDYAAGLGISKYRGLRTVSHGGSFVGFRAGMLQFPDQRFSTYVLCNVASAQPMRLAHAVSDIYLESDFTEEKDAPIEGELSVPEAELEKWTGTYWDHSTGGLAEIEIVEGSLRWKEAERRFVPLGERRFAAVGATSRSDIRFDADGKSATMTVHSPGQRAFRYERVEPVAPTVGELARAIGLYRCSELDVTYRIELDEDERLVLVRPFDRSLLEAVFQNGFRWDHGSLVFRRNEQEHIESFELAAGRARNFIFERQ